MKSYQTQAATGKEAKAVSLMIACLAGSLVSSLTVVTLVVKWLTNS